MAPQFTGPQPPPPPPLALCGFCIGRLVDVFSTTELSMGVAFPALCQCLAHLIDGFLVPGTAPSHRLMGLRPKPDQKRGAGVGPHRKTGRAPWAIGTRNEGGPCLPLHAGVCDQQWRRWTAWGALPLHRGLGLGGVPNLCRLHSVGQVYITFELFSLEDTPPPPGTPMSSGDYQSVLMTPSQRPRPFAPGTSPGVSCAPFVTKATPSRGWAGSVRSAAAPPSTSP